MDAAPQSGVFRVCLCVGRCPNSAADFTSRLRPSAKGHIVAVVLICLVQAFFPGNATAMSPKAISETITGAYVGPGVTCPQFRLTSGETVSLSGAYPELVEGQTVTLTGLWAIRSKCMQGREFNVQPTRD